MTSILTNHILGINSHVACCICGFFQNMSHDCISRMDFPEMRSRGYESWICHPQNEVTKDVIDCYDVMGISRGHLPFTSHYL